MSTRKLLLLNVIIVLVVLAGGFLAYYFYNQSTLYLKTNDAQITGKQVSIIAPATGQLTDWKGTFGTTLKAGDTVGDVMTMQGGKPTTVPITIPTDGTIVQDNAVDGQIAAPGLPLAYAYDLHHLWVSANIKETQISDVKIGQTVDVYLDAYPDLTFKGTVSQIGLATAGTFSMLPSTNTSANFTKVTQVIPIVVTIQGYEGSNLVPGMSASIRIHK